MNRSFENKHDLKISITRYDKSINQADRLVVPVHLLGLAAVGLDPFWKLLGVNSGVIALVMWCDRAELRPGL